MAIDGKISLTLIVCSLMLSVNGRILTPTVNETIVQTNTSLRLDTSSTSTEALPSSTFEPLPSVTVLMVNEVEQDFEVHVRDVVVYSSIFAQDNLRTFSQLVRDSITDFVGVDRCTVIATRSELATAGLQHLQKVPSMYVRVYVTENDVIETLVICLDLYETPSSPIDKPNDNRITNDDAGGADLLADA